MKMIKYTWQMCLVVLITTPTLGIIPIRELERLTQDPIAEHRRLVPLAVTGARRADTEVVLPGESSPGQCNKHLPPNKQCKGKFPMDAMYQKIKGMLGLETVPTRKELLKKLLEAWSPPKENSTRILNAFARTLGRELDRTTGTKIVDQDYVDIAVAFTQACFMAKNVEPFLRIYTPLAFDRDFPKDGKNVPVAHLIRDSCSGMLQSNDFWLKVLEIQINMRSAMLDELKKTPGLHEEADSGAEALLQINQTFATTFVDVFQIMKEFTGEKFQKGFIRNYIFRGHDIAKKYETTVSRSLDTYKKNYDESNQCLGTADSRVINAIDELIQKCNEIMKEMDDRITKGGGVFGGRILP